MNEITSSSIAETILKQLGGHKFVAMTGSKNFMDMGNGLRMDLAKNISAANRCRVTLQSDDTYHVVFYKQSINKKTLDVTIKNVAEFQSVYCDQLQDIFTSVTGMYTSLGTLDYQEIVLLPEVKGWDYV